MFDMLRLTVGAVRPVHLFLRLRETFGSNTQNAVQIGMEAAHNAREAAADRHFQSRSPRRGPIEIPGGGRRVRGMLIVRRNADYDDENCNQASYA